LIVWDEHSCPSLDFGLDVDRVGRTLLSVAFDVDFDFDLDSVRVERGTLARLLLTLILILTVKVTASEACPERSRRVPKKPASFETVRL
jgi:hypothetical protein